MTKKYQERIGRPPSDGWEPHDSAAIYFRDAIRGMCKDLAIPLAALSRRALDMPRREDGWAYNSLKNALQDIDARRCDHRKLTVNCAKELWKRLNVQYLESEPVDNPARAARIKQYNLAFRRRFKRGLPPELVYVDSNPRNVPTIAVSIAHALDVDRENLINILTEKVEPNSLGRRIRAAGIIRDYFNSISGEMGRLMDYIGMFGNSRSSQTAARKRPNGNFDVVRVIT